jgi:hypothetical protein
MAQESKQDELRNEGKGRIGSINHLRLGTMPFSSPIQMA